MRLHKHHLLPEQSGRRRTIADLGLAVGQVRRFTNVQVDGVGGANLGQRPGRWRVSLTLRHVRTEVTGTVLRETLDHRAVLSEPEGREFNLENSHLRCLHKLRKLVALVSLADAFYLSVGQAADRRTPVTRKNHGYRATSLSRHGLNTLAMCSKSIG